MAKSIMIQGTMSGAGKSLTAGALCRIFTQDGYRTAPFKSQNMALNSYVTYDGFEMGRAQVMQAEAAMREPDVRMNPILLKPTSDVGSQVIINGVPIGNMPAKEYFKRKIEYIPVIRKAYESLAAENDIIVIEGAGSPAEINLKTNDIVNMGMAKIASSPVLLVGDIDRGGVFAQLYGTTELLDTDEKEFIKGLIINKFRGDKSILKSGLDIIESLTDKPVLGVVPYADVDIDEEDSLAERLNVKTGNGVLDIAVIRLPHISNFTDFTPFECIGDVSLRYVKNECELGEPDLIIIPGTKNTIGDLLYIRQNGLEAAVIKRAERGTAVIGICGGYQMLGMEIYDPNCTEHGGRIRGMCLLDTRTVFGDTKKTVRANGKIGDIGGVFKDLKDLPIEGYEIHMGETEVHGKSFADLNVCGSMASDGAVNGNIYGTYVHGLFDSAAVTETVIDSLMREKGIEHKNIKSFDMKAYKDKQYNKLADIVRANIDMNKIYEIMGITSKK